MEQQTQTALLQPGGQTNDGTSSLSRTAQQLRITRRTHLCQSPEQADRKRAPATANLCREDSASHVRALEKFWVDAALRSQRPLQSDAIMVRSIAPWASVALQF